MNNTIIRAARRDRYLMIDQRAIEDTRLSWAARGLLGYLLSRPDDWKVLVNDLRKRGDLGRDGIYRLLRELRDTGYVRFVRQRDAQGRMRGGTYYVQEIAAAPHPDWPDAEKPDPAAPLPVRPEALPITDIYLKDTTTPPTTSPTTTKDHRSRFEASGVEFATWIPQDLRGPALKRIAGLDREAAQTVLDEWAGRMLDESISISPLGYLQTMSQRYREGDFSSRFANVVAGNRSRPDELKQTMRYQDLIDALDED